MAVCLLKLKSTFDEATAKQVIGERVPGSVVKRPCDPFEFISKKTGEIVNPDYRRVYVAEGSTNEEAIKYFENEFIRFNFDMIYIGFIKLSSYEMSPGISGRIPCVSSNLLYKRNNLNT